MRWVRVMESEMGYGDGDGMGTNKSNERTSSTFS